MSILYDSYQHDPMQMLTPQDIAEVGTVVLEDLPANCHYLHDQSLIELLVGYNPPMFAAARIAPKGIDLYENDIEFDKAFPLEATEDDLRAPNVIPLMMQLAQEIEASSLDGIRLEWLLRDVSHLREELRRPEYDWRAEPILNDLRWVEALIEQDGELRLLAFEQIADTLRSWLT